MPPLFFCGATLGPLRVASDGEHVLAEFCAELGRAVHDEAASFGGVHHVVGGHEDTEGAVEAIKPQGEEGHGAFVFATTGAAFAGFDADVGRDFGVVVDRPAVDAVGRFAGPIVHSFVAVFVQGADAAAEQVKEAFDEQDFGGLVFWGFFCAEQAAHFHQHGHEGDEHAGVFCGADHFRQGFWAHFALEEGDKGLNAFEL